MAIREGRHQLGTGNGRITLRTTRAGLAAQAGHDLTLEAERWSGEVVVGPAHVPTSLEVRVDLAALAVRGGSGGIKPLTDKDKRDIIATTLKTLGTDRHPEAVFTATDFEPVPGEPVSGGTGGTIAGTLTLHGQTRPQRLEVTEAGPDRYRATTTVRQTDYGIRPYSGFLGSLKVADDVGVEAEVDISPATGSGLLP